MKKYSIQFELYGGNSTRLLASAIKLGPVFCEAFPVSTETGYICYQHLPVSGDFAPQEFWYSVVEAKTLDEAYESATKLLAGAPALEKPFPVDLAQVRDTTHLEALHE